MTTPELKAALDVRLQGRSRNDAAGRAALISRTYRDGGGSGGITSEADALAYALVRMPATDAAVTASLNAFREIRPEFAPARLFRGWLGRAT
jgi:ribosomal protein RSM22 (predicted rRNA methylase)